MKMIDVTLRDGGHLFNFAWEPAFVSSLIEASSELGATYVELGYWSQFNKTTGPFYSLNAEKIDAMGIEPSRRLATAVMVDYHYADHNPDNYPLDGTVFKLLRITAKPEWLTSAIDFAQTLKAVSNLTVSINLVNVSSYASVDLLDAVDRLSDSSIDIVYFADTHGALKLEEQSETFDHAVSIVHRSGKEAGIHLHDHSGRAYSNYLVANQIGFDFFDASLHGWGKGAGNLRIEDVQPLERVLKLFDASFEAGIAPLNKGRNVFNTITGHLGVTDQYVDLGLEAGHSPSQFFRIVRGFGSSSKDSLDRELYKDAGRSKP